MLESAEEQLDDRVSLPQRLYWLADLIQVSWAHVESTINDACEAHGVPRQVVVASVESDYFMLLMESVDQLSREVAAMGLDTIPIRMVAAEVDTHGWPEGLRHENSADQARKIRLAVGIRALCDRVEAISPPAKPDADSKVVARPRRLSVLYPHDLLDPQNEALPDGFCNSPQDVEIQVQDADKKWGVIFVNLSGDRRVVSAQWKATDRLPTLVSRAGRIGNLWRLLLDLCAQPVLAECELDYGGPDTRKQLSLWLSRASRCRGPFVRKRKRDQTIHAMWRT